jgi:hypothetical protein
VAINATGAWIMTDILMLAAVVAAFCALGGYTLACERL